MARAPVLLAALGAALIVLPALGGGSSDARAAVVTPPVTEQPLKAAVSSQMVPTSPAATLTTAAHGAERPFTRAASGPYVGAPPVTRRQILSIAASALGTPYVHGGESWAPSFRGVGTDCSGLIAKAWQVPSAVETWEEQPQRPTTQTLSIPTTGWQKVRAEEREPGDILVRFGKLVKHAFIYERDVESTENQPEIWVYEAAEPRVAHRRYRLAELTAYRWMRRRNLDDVGIVGRARNWVFGDMVDAFRSAGGEAVVGVPRDRGVGMLAYAWSTADDAGAAQDFDGGTLGPALLVHSNRRAASLLLSGAQLEAFQAHGGLRGLRNPRATTPGCSVQALVASAGGCSTIGAKAALSGSGPLLAEWGP